MRSSHAFVAAGAVFLAAGAGVAAPPAAQTPDWAVNATVIEACSCPMFCQCFFNDKPAGHHTAAGHKHFCKGNLAWKINAGHRGAVKLDGVTFWLAGDLGGDLRSGQGEWAIVTHQATTTPEQREAVSVFLQRIFPMKWKSYAEAEGVIDTWRQDKDTAVATLDGGKTAEIRLKRFPGMSAEPILIRNLPYVAAPRNDGFALMPNEVEAYRKGPDAFEFKGTNGFTVTVDVTSNDPLPAPPGAGGRN
jgi:hypothetical protein